jgi:hypothetical protein
MANYIDAASIVAGAGRGSQAIAPVEQVSLGLADADAHRQRHAEAGRAAHRIVARRPVSRSYAAWPAGSRLITCPTHSPVGCLVAVLSRFQVLIDAIESTSAASWASS